MMERAVLKALKKFNRFVVTMHVNPDADAVAAALSMTLFLKSKGKKVRLVNQDECPKWLTFVPCIELYETFDEKRHTAFDPEVLIVLDCGASDRIGTVEKLARPGVKVINVDHHVTNTRFGDWNLVLVGYSSTCEILFQLMKKGGCRFTKDMAVLLYLGILTDTGSFGYDCTGSHTHEVIAELLRFKLSVSTLYRQVYETMPRQDLKRFLTLMNHIELFYDNRVACLTMTRKHVEVFSGEFDLKDKVFTFLRSVKGLEIIVILTEQQKTNTRLNFRSRNSFDVAELAECFGGGGHRNASGGFLSETLAHSKVKVLGEIRKRLSPGRSMKRASGSARRSS
jgi:phosphoesterase RecJ-like protein